MSGSYRVQQGDFAVITDQHAARRPPPCAAAPTLVLRAAAARWAIASAEEASPREAAWGVLAATGAVDTLVFGSEVPATRETLKAVAAALRVGPLCRVSASGLGGRLSLRRSFGFQPPASSGENGVLTQPNDTGVESARPSRIKML